MKPALSINAVPPRHNWKCHTNKWQNARIELILFLRSDMHPHWFEWHLQL